MQCSHRLRLTFLASLACSPACTPMKDEPVEDHGFESSGRQLTAMDFSGVDAVFKSAISSGLYPNGVRVLVYLGDGELYRFSHVGAYPRLGSSDTSVWPIASASKWLSAAVAARALDRPNSPFNLTDTIGQHLGGWGAKGSTTIEQCWNMTSGLILPSPDLEGKDNPDDSLELSVSKMAYQTPQVFGPGTQWGYEGDGIQVAGRIIEKTDRDRRDWRTIASQDFFSPLGMDGSNYDFFSAGPSGNPGVPGGAKASLADYQKFLRIVLFNGLDASNKTFLSNRAIARFFTNATAGLPAFTTPWIWNDKTLYPYDTKPTYGFGSWVITNNAGTVEEVASPGAFGAWPWVDRKRNIRGMIMMFEPSGFATHGRTNLEAIRALRAAIDGAGGGGVGGSGGAGDGGDADSSGGASGVGDASSSGGWVDGGPSEPTAVDAATEANDIRSGCGCRAGARASDPGYAQLTVPGLAVLYLVRRRRIRPARVKP